jgi:putative transposase
MDARTFLPPRPPRRKPVRWHVGKDGVVSIFGVECTCIENSKAGYVFAHVGNPRITFPLSVAEFDELKDLESFRYDKDGLSAETSHALLHSGVRSLSDLPKEQRDYVNRKVRACRTFLQMERDGLATRGDVGMPLALATIQLQFDRKIRNENGKRGGRPPFKVVGAKAFREWLDRFEKDGPLGLCERYHLCGNRQPYYTPDEWELLFEYVWKYLSPERVTIKELHRQMDTAANGTDGINAKRRRRGQRDLRVPDDDLLRREIARLPAFDVMAARYSEAEAINFFRAAQGGVPGLVQPMQRVEADEWTVHLQTLAIELGLWKALSPALREKAKKVRVCLAAALCCLTRCIVGMTVAPEASSQSTRMLLRMSLMDKTAIARFVGAETPWEYRGLIGNFSVDEGSSNVNLDTPMICADLGIGFKVPQAEMPTQRGKIERLFQTFDIRALIRFSGRTFSNPAMRKKYNSLARACVTVDEFCALIVRFVVDEYHNTPHAGLNGEMPRACWLRLTKKYPPTVPPGRAKIRNVFGEDITATLEPSGLRVFGNWYWSPSLQKIFENAGKTEVNIRVDTEDLGAISVRRPDGWLSVAGPEFMDGVSLGIWESANESMRRQNGGMEDMLKPLVRRAIAYALKADEATRKRLLIQYRPMTGEDLERARKRMWIGVRDKRDPGRASQPAQMDLFAGALPTGKSARRSVPRRKTVVDAAVPAKHPKTRSTTKTRPARRPRTKERPAANAPEKTRGWTIRGRRS